MINKKNDNMNKKNEDISQFNNELLNTKINEQNQKNKYSEILSNKDFFDHGSPLSFELGKDIKGKLVFCDLAKESSIMMAGASGSGKSVILRNIITSIICKNSPRNVKLVLIDPIYIEFSKYENIPHLMFSEMFYEPEDTLKMFDYIIDEINNRYKILKDNNVEDIDSYNSSETVVSGEKDIIPHIVIAISEISTIMHLKEIETKMVYIAKMGKNAGIHIIVSIQNVSKDILTKRITDAFKTKIILSVLNKQASILAFGQEGAELLNKGGDMLYIASTQSEPLRLQAPYTTEKEEIKIIEIVANEYND